MVGVLLEMQKKPAEARAQYEKVLAINPRAPVAANNLAWMYAEEDGNLDVALQLAQTAKSQLADVPEVNDTLGWIYQKRGLSAMAVSPLEQAVAKDPNNAMYQYHLGLAYASTGASAKARQALQRSLALEKAPAQIEAVKTALAQLQG